MYVYKKMFDYGNNDKVDFMKIQFCNCVLKIPIAAHNVGNRFEFISKKQDTLHS